MKRIRKKIRIALVAAFVLLVAFAASALGETAPDAAAPLPEIGSTVQGFKVLSHYAMDNMNATCVHMEHEKTGAQAIYIARDDTNRSFSITFRTPAKDDKGIPHVYEHATLCGSEKYPDPSLFFSMMSQTYNTFLNAMTMQSATTFPSASLSEEQLFTFMDYTLSGVFYPLIMTDERAMMREAYRYELADRDAELTLSGTVYSEMQGAIQLSNMGFYNTMKIMYPGSITTNIAGGDPDVIPTLTHQELKDFHDTYYHPSNSLIVLYGKLDLNRFLQKIDADYLSAFDRREITLDDSGYKPTEGYHEARFVYPAAEDASAQPVAIYAFSLKDATREELNLLQIASRIMMVEGMPLRSLLLERLPEAIVSVSLTPDTVEPTLCVLGMNISEEQLPLFKQTVDEAIAQIVEKGLDGELLESACRKLDYDNVMQANHAASGTNLMMEIVSAWGSKGDITTYQTDNDVSMRLFDYLKEDAYNATFRKFLTNPTLSALTLTTPDQGGLERKSAALKQSLAEMKAAMTDEEIDALVARTADFNAWTAANAESTMIDKVKAVDVRTLPEEVVRYQADDKLVDGMRVVTAQAELGDIVTVSLRFDTDTIPLESLHDYKLYQSLLGTLPTENYSLDELMKKLAAVMFEYSFYGDNVKYEDGSIHPTFILTWTTSRDQLEESFALVEEILFRSDFTDAETIRQRSREYSFMQRYAASALPSSLLDSYLDQYLTENGAVIEYISGTSFGKFYAQFADKTDDEIAAYAERFQLVRDILFNQNGFVFTCLGNATVIDEAVARAGKLYRTLDATPREKADYSAVPPLPEAPLAIVVDGTMQYNGQAIRLDDLGLEDNGNMTVMSNLVYDKILINVLRFQNSAYGANSSFGGDVLYVSSYRDPKLPETYDVFARLGDLVRELKVTQDDLDGYITSAYSSLAMPLGAVAGSKTAIADAITGEDTFAKYLRYMREVKQFTPADVLAYADAYDALGENGVKVTVGGVEMIEKNSDLFKSINTEFMEE